MEKGGGENQTVGEAGPREARVTRGQWEVEKGRGDEQDGGEALVTRGHGWWQVEEGGEDCCRHLRSVLNGFCSAQTNIFLTPY